MLIRLADKDLQLHEQKPSHPREDVTKGCKETVVVVVENETQMCLLQKLPMYKKKCKCNPD